MQTYNDFIWNVTLLVVDTGEIFSYTDQTHDVSGNIQRSSIQGIDSGEITIKNIPPQTFSRFWKPTFGIYANTRQIVLRCEIGRYGLGLYTVCEKDVLYSSYKKAGQTFEATFVVKSAHSATASNLSINTQNTTLTQILNDFSQQTGVPIGGINVSENSAVSYITPPQKGHLVLKELARAFPNVDIYIDNNKLYAIDSNLLKNIVGYNITSQQLISTPSLEGNEIAFDAHLDPRIGVNDIINLESDVVPFLNGKYRTKSVNHNFNFNIYGDCQGTTKVNLLYLQTAN